MKSDVAELMRLLQTLRRRRPPRHFASMFQDLELTQAQTQALMTLHFDGAMPIGSLADRIGSSVSSCTGIVDRLEVLELVQRGQKPGDRRVVLVELTRQGRELTEQAAGGFQEHLSKVMGLLSAADRKSFLAILRRLLEALDAAEQGEP